MSKPTNAKEKKGVAWYIPPTLRHWLNSHAEYLSAIGKETSTDAMVVDWLKERLKVEESKRDPRVLERAMEPQDQNGTVLHSTHEGQQTKVRGTIPQTAGAAPTKKRKP